MELYDKKQIDWKNILFNNKALFGLILPIIVEQFFNSFIGMVDIMMVSTVGSYAISAVSLVDSINNLVIQIFAAMAAGAVIICSQYIGSGDREECNRIAKQVVLTVLMVSLSITIFCTLGGERLLRLIFGTVEQAVMEHAFVYFIITAISYPFLALFSAGAAFYRASGNSRFPMKISVLSNIINVIGNVCFIYGLKWGVAGAAFATLFARVFGTVVLYIYLRKPKQMIVVKDYLKVRPDMALILKIMTIGIPAGIENGMFQFGKIAIASTISTMGTIAMSAQAMTDIFENINGIFSNGVGVGLMTVVGQSIGAHRKEEAKYYIVKLMGIAWIGVLVSCLLVLAITKPVIWLSKMEPEAAKICFQLVIAMTIVKPLLWVGAFGLPYGLRAAGDVRFSMLVSVSSMWCFRVVWSTFLVRTYGLGLKAVWIGIFTDWIVRAGVFSARFISGKWLCKKLL